VKTTLDIPDELLAQLKERAVREGQDIDQLASSLIAAGLQDFQGERSGGGTVPKTLPLIKAQAMQTVGQAPVISKDPETGLPVIHSPPDAPIHSMTAEQLQAIIDEELLKQDLERAGVSIRY
jgi:hypothetical protein